jgi:murein DD-endopeptidase MepM/ murein hydrolase activator NlpD
MKSNALKTAGSASTSVSCQNADSRPPASAPRASALLISTALLIVSGLVLAQTLYKYKGPDGEWVYTDRAPEEDESPVAETRDLPTGDKDPVVTVASRLVGRQIQLYAKNDFYGPVELVLGLDVLEDVKLPPPEQSLRWVLPPRRETELMQLDALDDARAPSVSYRYLYLHGDPDSEHEVERPYRAPFALANDFMVSQTYPIAITHNTVDSYYAVDFVMPVGTDIYAARGGLVVEVASTNFRAGTDPKEEGASANLVRILHEDGTYAIYAHLNWNTIRVEPGDDVQRGEYIADSGNTGFSTGPHLHFVVMRNNGMRVESLPVVFEGPNGAEIEARSGQELTAY